MKGHVLRRLSAQAPAIFALYAGGAAFEEISARYDCSWQTVRRFLIANDIPLRTPVWKLKLDPFENELCEAYTNGVGILELSHRYGVQPQTVRKFLVAKHLVRKSES